MLRLRQQYANVSGKANERSALRTQTKVLASVSLVLVLYAIFHIAPTTFICVSQVSEEPFVAEKTGVHVKGT